MSYDEEEDYDEEYDDEYGEDDGSCRAPALTAHRKLIRANDERIISELHRAWSRPDNEHGEDRDYVRQDWATFRAITLREARRRRLKIPSVVRALITKRGVNL